MTHGPVREQSHIVGALNARRPQARDWPRLFANRATYGMQSRNAIELFDLIDPN